jgi:hypothetical protein
MEEIDQSPYFGQGRLVHLKPVIKRFDHPGSDPLRGHGTDVLNWCLEGRGCGFVPQMLKLLGPFAATLYLFIRNAP